MFSDLKRFFHHGAYFLCGKRTMISKAYNYCYYVFDIRVINEESLIPARGTKDVIE